MTSLRVICGLGPPNQKSWLRLCPDCTASFEEMLQRWRAIDNTVSDLIGLRFEPLTSRSRGERVTARPTGRSLH